MSFLAASESKNRVVDQIGSEHTAPMSRGLLRSWTGLVLPAIDLLALVLAMLGSWLVAGAPGSAGAFLGWPIVFSVLVLGGLLAGGAYRRRFSLHFLDDARAILSATAIAAMVVTFVRLVGESETSIASEGARMWLFSCCYLIAARGAYQLSRAQARRLGAGASSTLIVGAGEIGQMIAKRLASRPEFGLRPVAFFDREPLESSAGVGLPVLPDRPGADATPEAVANEIAETVRERGVGHVVIAFSLASHEAELTLLRRCRQLGASVSLVPRLFEAVPDQTSLERIGGIPLISVHARDPRAWQFALKYAIDRVAAIGFIIVVSPLMAVAAGGVLLSLGRPILFRQERVGLDGHQFRMLKFRTMHGRPEERGEADAGWASEITSGELPLPSEPRVEAGATGGTAFGSLLRRSGLDELPQLFNVLRGEMSLVGPRPERRWYAEAFERRVRRYDERHRVKAGITGWAQVHGLRGNTSLADRVEWDNYYIENWSPWLDVKIILLTIRAMFRGPHA